MEQIDLFALGHVLFECESTYSLQEPFIREITEFPLALSEFYGISLMATLSAGHFHKSSKFEMPALA